MKYAAYSLDGRTVILRGHTGADVAARVPFDYVGPPIEVLDSRGKVCGSVQRLPGDPQVCYRGTDSTVATSGGLTEKT